ncbi:ATP-binding protein [Parasporobacterium paucivorans]|uniref:Uncharacterized protein n=1 Tax=Parasporobacterium paucivorans DSM 15970 TaxID=1122934 RepID=A0A1M6C696_9FIRM|nr:ATP-binding protein [Parasporobacterium paucivorans]SHI56264.1 hypothetical protein SAMN02745691_00478 [Parasporobacterium paucivorans DSM 15970]
MNIRHLLLYRNFEEQELFNGITELMEISEGEDLSFKENTGELYKYANQLIELAGRFGFRGNIWRNFLAYILANHENAFSTSCEITREPLEGLKKIALNDFGIFRELFCFDITKIDRAFGVNCFSMLENFENNQVESKVYNCGIRDSICQLGTDLFNAEDAKAYYEIITDFYHSHGVGILGLHKAFRLKEEATGFRVMPVNNTQTIQLDDIIGYELQKKKLTDNTRAFVEGRPANNVLLFGDSGTGKSSSVKAILNEYYPQGLRMVEVYKHEFRYLSELIEKIKDRNYRFIIYMDDLSFEDYEIEYKYLKAIIEGGIAIKPDNVLIYATSNRRHLIREKWSDKEERTQDLHTSDTVQEKLSLAARFGVSIYFGSPDKKEFERIVLELAGRHGLDTDREELLREANKWEVSHGGLSGRSAAQFVSFMQGNSKK